MATIKSFEDFLDRMQGLLDNAKKQGHIIVPVEELENAFPELAESEDERIRKLLVEAVTQVLQDQYCSNRGISKENVIAWLEKQGEQKPTIEMITPEESLGIDSETYSKIVDECVYGEQKPADKVEPKFKEGDFITNDYCFGKVVALTNDAYLLDTEQGIPFSCEHNAHLWTIQDAKDGDVLCTYECDKPKIVFILKGTPKKHYALSYHCYCNIMYPHFASDSEKGCLAPNDEDVKPATKEQRDTLERAMHNAGYEWDAIHKQLKKIEQKPIAWSEEDEHKLNYVITQLKAASNIIVDDEIDDSIAFVKSLKDKVQPQPKKEWSEEDKAIIDYLLQLINNSHKEPCTKGLIAFDVEAWLKSLRPQVTWKPSDDEMKALAEALSLANNCGEEYAFDLRTLQDQLKKLK